MPNNPTAPINPGQSADFMKNDIPAETDDLELGKRNPEEGDRIRKARSHPHAKPRRDGGAANIPNRGRH